MFLAGFLLYAISTRISCADPNTLYPHTVCLSLFILMDYPIQLDALSMSLLFFKGLTVKILKLYISDSEDCFFSLANGADPDEMPPNQKFYCLTNYLFTGIRNQKG